MRASAVTLLLQFRTSAPWPSCPVVDISLSFWPFVDFFRVPPVAGGGRRAGTAPTRSGSAREAATAPATRTPPPGSPARPALSAAPIPPARGSSGAGGRGRPAASREIVERGALQALVEDQDAPAAAGQGKELGAQAGRVAAPEDRHLPVALPQNPEPQPETVAEVAPVGKDPDPAGGWRLLQVGKIGRAAQQVKLGRVGRGAAPRISRAFWMLAAVEEQTSRTLSGMTGLDHVQELPADDAPVVVVRRSARGPWSPARPAGHRPAATRRRRRRRPRGSRQSAVPLPGGLGTPGLPAGW